MDNLKFKEYLDVLGKEQDSNKLLKLLTNIRGLVDWPKNRDNINLIRDTGSLKPLLNMLQTQQRKHILDVCLSILGNCVMERNCAREMIGVHNALSALNHVLKRYPKEDSINGRVFRVLGNLCQHKELWANLVISRKPQLITHLLELLSRTSENTDVKEKHSEATILMAIRSLKYLINIRTVNDLLHKFPILNTIGSLFIKSSQEWQTNQTNENILNSLITFISHLSRYKDYSMVTKLKTTTQGDVLKELVNVLLLNPKTIIKIIMNFITISKLNSDLPVLEVCNKFIDEVVKKNLNKEGFKTECLEHIKCLCILLDHPANRTSQQCGKTISVLITVLEKMNQPTDTELECCVLLVNTLNKCQYAELLVQEQLQSNIIHVVMKKLQWLVDNTIITRRHSINRGRKRKWDFEGAEMYPQGSYFVKRRMCSCCLERLDLSNFDCPMAHNSRTDSPSASDTDEDNEDDGDNVDDAISDDDENNADKQDREISYFSIVAKYNRSISPCSSASSDYPAVSWASPCSSPRSIRNEFEVDSDSDDYSPICSEADSTENPLNKSLELEESVEEERTQSDEECAQSEDGEPCREPLPDTNTNRLKISLIFEITRLIRSFIKIRPPIAKLGCEKLLIALLNCSEFFDTEISTDFATVNVVCDILHSPSYLLPLLKTEFIEKIYDMKKSFHRTPCLTCREQSNTGKVVMKRLAELAASGQGKQYIELMMRSGAIDVKRQAALVVPYIIEDKKTLADMLLTKGGLAVLTQLLKEETYTRRRAIRALHALASKKLKIANPRRVAINVLPTLASFSDKPDDRPYAKLVTFKLDDGRCVQADRDLLMEKSVYFANLLNGSFKEGSEEEVRLHDVKFETLNCLLNLIGSVKFGDDVKLDILLDVIALSDRYLMNDICSLVTNYVQKREMNAFTVAKIYKWSLESRLDLLRVESVAILLVDDILDGMRFNVFGSLLNNEHRDDLTNDIKQLIERYLTSYR